MQFDEVIHPPRGYCVAVFDGNTGVMVGPFQTEKEARDAWDSAYICAVGGPWGWHETSPQ